MIRADRGLRELGKKCHLLLANGAFAKKPHNDENYEVRQELRDVVDMHEPHRRGNHFAHNKFVVFCDSGGTPTSVLSGSTNWAKTGLCTQANNAVIVDSPELAADFLNQWNLLKAAGNGYPDSLAEANSRRTRSASMAPASPSGLRPPPAARISSTPAS